MKSKMSAIAYLINFLLLAVMFLPWSMIFLAPILVILSVFTWTIIQLFSKSKSNYKILIVDDDEISLTPMLLALQRQNKPLTVSYVKSAEEAIDALKKNHFDLLILDYLMPGLSGKELLSEVEKSPEFQSTTSVVYYTSDIGFLSRSDNFLYKKFKVYDKWAKKTNYRLLNNKIESLLLAI